MPQSVGATSSAPVTEFAGELFKQAFLQKDWRRMYFVLEEGVLFAFRSAGNANPKGMLFLSDCVVAPCATTETGWYTFEITHPKNSNPWRLRTDSEDSYKKWLGVLSSASSPGTTSPESGKVDGQGDAPSQESEPQSTAAPSPEATGQKSTSNDTATSSPAASKPDDSQKATPPASKPATNANVTPAVTPAPPSKSSGSEAVTEPTVTTPSTSDSRTGDAPQTSTPADTTPSTATHRRTPTAQRVPAPRPPAASTLPEDNASAMAAIRISGKDTTTTASPGAGQVTVFMDESTGAHVFQTAVSAPPEVLHGALTDPSRHSNWDPVTKKDTLLESSGENQYRFIESEPQKLVDPAVSNIVGVVVVAIVVSLAITYSPYMSWTQSPFVFVAMTVTIARVLFSLSIANRFVAMVASHIRLRDRTNCVRVATVTPRGKTEIAVLFQATKHEAAAVESSQFYRLKTFDAVYVIKPLSPLRTQISLVVNEYDLAPRLPADLSHHLVKLHGLSSISGLAAYVTLPEVSRDLRDAAAAKAAQSDQPATESSATDEASATPAAPSTPATTNDDAKDGSATADETVTDEIAELEKMYTVELPPNKYTPQIHAKEAMMWEAVNATPERPNGWVYHSTTNGVEVSRKQTPTGVAVKGVGIVKAAPRPILEFLQDMSRKREIDSLFDKGEDLEVIDGQTLILHECYKSIWPTTARDFVMAVRVKELPDKSVTVLATSVDYPPCPPAKKGYVRGDTVLGAWVLQAIPAQTGVQPWTKVFYIAQVDLKGSIPSRIVNMAATEMPKCVAVLRSVMLKEKIDPKWDRYYSPRPARTEVESSTTTTDGAGQDESAPLPLAGADPASDFPDIDELTVAPSVREPTSDSTDASTKDSPSDDTQEDGGDNSDDEYVIEKPGGDGDQWWPDMNSAIDELQAVCASPTDQGFEYQFEKSGVKVWKKFFPGTPVAAVCGRKQIKAPPQALFDLLRHVERKTEYDPMFKRGYKAHEFNEHNAVLYQAFHAVWPTTARDFVSWSHWRKQRDGGFAIVARSIKWPDCPEQKGFVRADIGLGAWMIAPAPPATPGSQTPTSTLTFLAQVDLKGSIPARIVNLISNKQPMCLLEIDKVICRQDLGKYDAMYRERAERKKKAEERKKAAEEAAKAAATAPPEPDTTSADNGGSGARDGESASTTAPPSDDTATVTSTAAPTHAAKDPEPTPAPPSAPASPVKASSRGSSSAPGPGNASATGASNDNGPKQKRTRPMSPPPMNAGPDEYHAVATAGLDAIQFAVGALPDADPLPWEFLTTHEGVDVSRLRGNVNSPPLFMGKLVIDAPIQQILAVLMDVENRPEWDPDTTQAQLLEVLSEDSRVDHITYAAVSASSPRDYCLLSTWRWYGDCIGLAVRSVVHPSCGEQTGTVRAEILVGGYWLRPVHSTQTEVLHVQQTDLKGWLPTTVVIYEGVKSASKLQNLRTRRKSS